MLSLIAAMGFQAPSAGRLMGTPDLTVKVRLQL